MARHREMSATSKLRASARLDRGPASNLPLRPTPPPNVVLPVLACEQVDYYF